MPLKKSDPYSFIWASCDQLRGGMDASQYKELFITFDERMIVATVMQKRFTGRTRKA